MIETSLAAIDSKAPTLLDNFIANILSQVSGKTASVVILGDMNDVGLLIGDEGGAQPRTQLSFRLLLGLSRAESHVRYLCCDEGELATALQVKEELYELHDLPGDGMPWLSHSQDIGEEETLASLPESGLSTDHFLALMRLVKCRHVGDNFCEQSFANRP